VLDFLADGCLGGLLDFLMPLTPWRLVVWLVIIGLVVGVVAAFNQWRGMWCNLA
jgi:F0F1-type ATP synthase assembly protein I